MTCPLPVLSPVQLGGRAKTQLARRREHRTLATEPLMRLGCSTTEHLAR